MKLSIKMKSPSPLLCFVGGIGTAFLIQYTFSIFKRRKNIKELPLLGDDNSFSLFYDLNPPLDGTGFPNKNTTSIETVCRMKEIHEDYVKLPKEFYKLAVESLPIVCVDVICKRKTDGQILLFYRRDSPAANIWWWPGGRMIRGETFFETAIRKIKDETGNLYAPVNAVGVLQVWNTFFPDSSWDAERKPSREGTQTVNVVVVVEIDSDLRIDVNANDWAVKDSKWIQPSEALVDGKYDKYIWMNVTKAISEGFLL